MYAPHCDLDDCQKDNLFDRLISVIRKVREREIVVITGDFISHVERNPEGLENQHGGCGYGIWNKEGAKILQFRAVTFLA